MYDYIIIGTGIAGYYTAYQLMRRYNRIKILMIDKNDYIGGRLKRAEFHGVKC